MVVDGGAAAAAAANARKSLLEKLVSENHP